MKLKLTILISFLFILELNAQDHPSLLLTKNGVEEMQQQMGSVPMFDQELAKVQKEVDQEIENGIEVPIPKDLAGGYTHDRHKMNFFILQKAGVVFQLTEDEKYAMYIKEVLFEYAKMYSKIGKHPAERSYARGKIFWQCLNDANWLVYVSQAYDCIYDWLSAKDRKYLEKELFRPYADYLSVENPQFFNRIHNHSTWGCAGVGMIGLVMEDEELVNRALYGLKLSKSDKKHDNDGGKIYDPKGAGFVKQIEELFSPEGYYSEGPYYQRYAIYPFLVFAVSLENKKPELGIFKMKNGALLNAVDALIQLSTPNGEFFPINDAQKGMSLQSRELIAAVDIAYAYGEQNPALLSIAKDQNKILLDYSGFLVAKGLAENLEKGYKRHSKEFGDGPDGTSGGLGILRARDLTLVMKYGTHGMGHGHFDKLSYSLYDGDHEVIQDYGMARYVNIEQKNGGGYLPENKTWAKQTIAHNTLVVDRSSQFGGKTDESSKFNPEGYSFSNEPGVQVVSAKENNSYPGVEMHRTVVVLTEFKYPMILDIYRVTSDQSHTYELPLLIQGQYLDSNIDLMADQNLSIMGEDSGFQHLWREYYGSMGKEQTRVSWLGKNKFYTWVGATEENDSIAMARIGANDPGFSLRRDPIMIWKKANAKSAVMASVFELHGHYNPADELAIDSKTSVSDLKVILNTEDYTLLELTVNSYPTKLFMISNKDNADESSHKQVIDGISYEWIGPTAFIIKKNNKNEN